MTAKMGYKELFSSSVKPCRLDAVVEPTPYMDEQGRTQWMYLRLELFGVLSESRV